MVKATFFSQNISLSTKKSDLKAYYIPVVEMIGDMQQVSAWKYTRNPLVSRMFYTSTDDLYAQEGLDSGRATMSCYKVMLNAMQIAALHESKSVGKGHLLALNFMPKDILSGIKISQNERTEIINPFYQARAVDTFEPSIAAPSA